MNERRKQLPIKGKVIIRGKINCRTGLHIGGIEESLGIGDIDSYIIRDPVTLEPYIPGSSLKGKLRSLMERSENKEFNLRGNKDVYRHECGAEDCTVCRVFGSSAGSISRLMVRDACLSQKSREHLAELDTDMPFVEIKVENTLDRVTAQASPRTLERVPAGAEFDLEIVYTVDTDEHKEEDIFNLLSLLSLLEDDALGGNASRGYGQISFSDLECIVKPLAFYRGEEKSEENIFSLTVESLRELEKEKGKIRELLNRI